MPEPGKFGEDSTAVQVHLNITQAVIARMASNSSSCKAWCITLVSAILVIVADKGKPTYALLAVIPTVLFLVLDAYYLALETCFRQAYNAFVDKLHHGLVESSDLYAVAPCGPILRFFGGALLSFSIWPFYGTLVGMIWLTKCIVIP